MKHVAKRIALDGDAAFCSVTSGAFLVCQCPIKGHHAYTSSIRPDLESAIFETSLISTFIHLSTIL